MTVHHSADSMTNGGPPPFWSCVNLATHTGMHWTWVCGCGIAVRESWVVGVSGLMAGWM